jgi:hypothetical protein
MDYTDKDLMRGLGSLGLAGLFWSYIIFREHYYVPWELVMLMAILCSLFGLFHICKSFYCKWMYGSQRPYGDNLRPWNQNDRTLNRNYNYGSDNSGPNFQTMNQSYYDGRSKPGVYTNKSQEMAEAYYRKQMIKQADYENKPQKSTQHEPSYVFGFKKNNDKQPAYMNPMSSGLQYEIDQGISCKREQNDRIAFKPGLFANMPERRESGGGVQPVVPAEHD